MSITKNINRIGSFTSSEVVALTTTGKGELGFGAPAITYIKEKNMERRLGMSLDSEADAKPLTWGKRVEKNVFDLLGMEYILTSTETDVHPLIDYWAGSKDGIKHDEGKTVFDIKCPFTRKSFCGLVQPLYDGLAGMDAMNAIRKEHKDGEKYYWQLVSNSVINNCKFAELIVYAPYQSELDLIRLEAQGEDNCMWLAFASDDSLPYIRNNGYYKNLNIIRFEVPQTDKDMLTECVLKAGKLLIERPAVSVVIHDQINGVPVVVHDNIAA